ncbi:putative WRKY transcription factor 4 [Wolffia australiana]
MAEDPSSEAPSSTSTAQGEPSKPLHPPPAEIEIPSIPAVGIAITPPSSSSPSKEAEIVESSRAGSEQRSPTTITMNSTASAAAFVSVPVDAMRLPFVAVPCFLAPASLLETSGFPSHFAITHQAVLATVTAQAQMQAAMAPISFAAPQAAASEEEQAVEAKAESTQTGSMKTPGDGFNWRKYGQKQVKGTENARSYYRCTHASCPAKKKVEHRHDGLVLEVIYRGGHNHEPPAKPRFAKDKKPLSVVLAHDQEISSPGSAMSPPASKSETASVAGDGIEKRLHCSSDCEAEADVKGRGAPVEEPDPKRRAVERPRAFPVVIKTAREPKIIKHAAADPGALSDGYRWRKYGQKFVKGNPNPRSYYRCTHAGCPARRHVEKDSADNAAVIINYEGNHNHDLPPARLPTAAAATAAVCPPPATELLVAAAAAIEAGDRAVPALPVSAVDQTPPESTADSSLESAQTLLSIGGPRQMFDDHRPPVTVQNS